MNPQRSRSSISRRGMTLIEAVVSLSVVSVLLLGLSSSMMLGARALPTGSELGIADRQVHDITNQIRADITNAREIGFQQSGGTARITLSMNPTGAMGEGSVIIYEFIGLAKMIRRRVDARAYEILTTQMDDYRFESVQDSGRLRYGKIQLRFDNTIQQRFELFIPTPYRPEIE